MKLQDNTQHLRKIRTVLEASEYEQIILEHIAKKLSVPMDNSFKGRAFVSTRDTSTGILKDIHVEIDIDLSMYSTVSES